MGEKIPVQLKDVHDVNEFVNILSGFEGDFDLYCGRYCVDAKSILGIMTMDLRNQLFLTNLLTDATWYMHCRRAHLHKNDIGII